MSKDHTTGLSLRLDPGVLAALSAQAHAAGMEVQAYIQAVLRRHALESGQLAADERRRLLRNDRILQLAVARAREVHAAGGFDEHFILTVMRRLIAEPDFRALYEEAVGGDAFTPGLPEKSPLNMYLGWHIRHAVGAEPLLDSRGRTRRATVRGEVLQSYMLLASPAADAAGDASPPPPRRVQP